MLKSRAQQTFKICIISLDSARFSCLHIEEIEATIDLEIRHDLILGISLGNCNLTAPFIVIYPRGFFQEMVFT